MKELTVKQQLSLRKLANALDDLACECVDDNEFNDMVADLNIVARDLSEAAIDVNRMIDGNRLVHDLIVFKRDLNLSVGEMLDIIDGGGEYESRFDVKIESNGQSVQLPMSSEIFERMQLLLNTAIEEA